jgi:hypothetical protein
MLVPRRKQPFEIIIAVAGADFSPIAFKSDGVAPRRGANAVRKGNCKRKFGEA